MTPFFEDNSKEWTRDHKLTVSLVDIDKGIQPPTNYLISVPLESSMEQYVVSPDARHILWQLSFAKPHPVPGHTGLYRTSEIWVCDLDGAAMHRLAYQAVHVIPITPSDETLRDIAWKDNQTVSFFLGGVLYSMPLR